MNRIVSLLPAGTEIAAALGLMDQVVGVSHECDFPEQITRRPQVTRCPIHHAGLTSAEVDAWVRRALHENGTIYAIDEPLLRTLQPDVILTQRLCDVCAVGYGTVAKLAQTLPGPPRVVSLEPTSLADIFEDIRRVADACDVRERADKLIGNLSERVENVRERAARISDRPRCFLMEWVDPPFCPGHWGPELVEIAGGHDLLGRKHQPSTQIDWQQVLDARPEIIVLALCGYDIDRARRDYELLRRFPGFGSIPAAASGQVHVVNASAYFARPGPRIVDSLAILAGILHPGEFSEFVSRGPGDRRVVRIG
jgi:iron complex transport system substrate-binding protein